MSRSQGWVVFISYFYPPNPAVGGLRLRGFAENLRDSSADRYRPLVVTVGATSGLSHQEHNVAVFRTADRRVRRPSTARPHRESGAERHALERWLSAAKANLLIPDEQVFWLLDIRSISRTVDHLCKKDVIAVVASTPPPTGFLMGSVIARSSRAPLILDYRDPWTYNVHFRRIALRRRADAFLERLVLGRASGIVCANPQARRYLPLASAELPPTVEILTGCDPSSSVPEPPRDGPLCLLFAGQLYSGVRDPTLLLEAMRQFMASSLNGPESIRATFVGVDSWLATELAVKCGVEQCVTAVPQVSYNEVKRLMAGSHVLVSLQATDDRDSGAIPGKIFDYMSTGRPVICVGSTNVALQSLMRESGAGYCASTVADCLDVLRMVDEHRRAGERLLPSTGDLAPFTKAASARRLVDFIDAVRTSLRAQ